jgi:4-methyl-5(b-hydroxyethyl)-thiazole monophosphate biosynthesis
MTWVVILLASQFETETFAVPFSWLSAANATVTVALVDDSSPDVFDNRSVQYLVRDHLKDISDKTFDAVIIPGGYYAATAIANSSAATDFLKRHNGGNKWICAISESPGLVLGPAGLLKGKKACGLPTFDNLISQNGGTKVDDKTVVDHNIITGRGPGVAQLFAQEIIKQAMGADVARQVMKDKLVTPSADWEILFIVFLVITVIALVLTVYFAVLYVRTKKSYGFDPIN